MEKIDLTKCNNLRYKAKIDGNDDYGRICVENAESGLAFLRSDREDGYIATWHCDEMLIRGISGREVTGFEIVPRDPETYQDWQVGDIVLDSCEDSDWRVIFRSGEFVVVADNCSEDKLDIIGCYTCSQLFREGWRLILTDIERQIIEGKKYEPQDGDIVAWQSKENSAGWAISIYEEKDGSYMTLFTTGSCRATDSTLDMQVIRPATDEEKQLLFDAMSKEGKRWNAEKKIVEDIPKPHEFRKGEPVLVRNYDDNIWQLAAFRQRSGDASYPYEIRNELGTCYNYRKCIPYNERTMHLLGTTEDYKEE